MSASPTFWWTSALLRNGEMMLDSMSVAMRDARAAVLLRPKARPPARRAKAKRRR